MSMRVYNRSSFTALIAAFLLLFVFSVLQPGYANKENDPARDLLAKTVNAMGGEKKACDWKTRLDTGIITAEIPGWGELRAKCTLSVKKPDKLKLDQDYSAFDHPFFYIFYYNRGEVWYNVNLMIRQSPRHTKLMTNKMRRIDGPAYFLTRCDTFFTVPDVPDDSLFSASDIDRIGVVDNGDTVFIDVNKKTYLPVRRIQDGGSTHVILGDYKEVEGLTLPFRETVFQDGRKTDYVWDEIKFNVKFDDAIFEENRPQAKKESG